MGLQTTRLQAIVIFSSRLILQTCIMRSLRRSAPSDDSVLLHSAHPATQCGLGALDETIWGTAGRQQGMAKGIDHICEGLGATKHAESLARSWAATLQKPGVT